MSCRGRCRGRSCCGGGESAGRDKRNKKDVYGAAEGGFFPLDSVFGRDMSGRSGNIPYKGKSKETGGALCRTKVLISRGTRDAPAGKPCSGGSVAEGSDPIQPLAPGPDLQQPQPGALGVAAREG